MPIQKIPLSLHSQYRKTVAAKNGALVQLVRIRACHARGQGFESPTHRQPRGGDEATDLRSRNKRSPSKGALVQLVRIRACHARGQGFESPTHRRTRKRDGYNNRLVFFYLSLSGGKSKGCARFRWLLTSLGAVVVFRSRRHSGTPKRNLRVTTLRRARNLAHACLDHVLH